MRYHKDIGFPKTLILPDQKFYLIYTKHADKKGELIFGFKKIMHDLYEHIYVDKDCIIEVTTKDNINYKTLLVRYKVMDFDIVLSILPMNKSIALVLTVWNNSSSDHHKTLNKSKYDIPDNNNSKEIDEIYAGAAK